MEFDKELISNEKVVYFHDLKKSSDSGGVIQFHSFSYGDADVTLVNPSRLIDELSTKINSLDISADDDIRLALLYKDLIEEIKSIPKGILVGFEG